LSGACAVSPRPNGNLLTSTTGPTAWISQPLERMRPQCRPRPSPAPRRAVNPGQARQASCRRNAYNDPAAPVVSRVRSSDRTRHNTADIRVSPRAFEQRVPPRVARPAVERKTSATGAGAAGHPQAPRRPACAG
jgi:hypothetical protein